MDQIISELRAALAKCRQSMQGVRPEDEVLAKLRAAEERIVTSICLLEEHTAGAAAG